MIPLIDMDIVAYRVASTVREDESFDLCEYRIDTLLTGILDACDAEEYLGVLSGPDNFRKTINPEYKANRKDLIKPVYLDSCKDYLVENWKAVYSEGVEADDVLGYNQTKNTIICSIDKDLRQIPGKHFNFVKLEFDEVDMEQGDKFFWKQMLIGDSTDNIFGVKGIGKVKAAKIIDPCESEQECFDIVWEKYEGDAKRFVMNAQCLWIMRKEKTTWVSHQDLILPDQLKPEMEAALSCMQSMNLTT